MLPVPGWAAPPPGRAPPRRPGAGRSASARRGSCRRPIRSKQEVEGSLPEPAVVPVPGGSPIGPPASLDARLEAELRRGAVQLVTMVFLSTPRYGYDLVRQLSTSGFDVEEGTLYPILRRLEQQGLLDATWNTDGARPRKYYQLSDEGRRRLADMIETWRRVRDATDAAVEGAG